MEIANILSNWSLRRVQTAFIRNGIDSQTKRVCRRCTDHIYLGTSWMFLVWSLLASEVTCLPTKMGLQKGLRPDPFYKRLAQDLFDGTLARYFLGSNLFAGPSFCVQVSQENANILQGECKTIPCHLSTLQTMQAI